MKSINYFVKIIRCASYFIKISRLIAFLMYFFIFCDGQYRARGIMWGIKIKQIKFSKL